MAFNRVDRSCNVKVGREVDLCCAGEEWLHFTPLEGGVGDASSRGSFEMRP